MRLKLTLIFFLIFLSFDSCLTEAQEKADLGEQPPIEIKRNFGRVHQGQVASSVFEILNGSEYTWEIEGIRTTCHCTSVEILSPAEPETNSKWGQDKHRIVNSGERLLIKMRIDTSNDEGALRQIAYVNLRYLGEARFIRLVMEGEVLTGKN
jgi:hypothetical protein